MDDKKPLLDLSTDNAVGFVTIEDDGKTLPYDLIKINNLSILQRQKLTDLGLRLSGLSEIKTEKDEDKYDNILLGILCLVIPSATKRILSKLPIMEKLDAVNAYMDASGLIKKKVTQLTKGKRTKKKNRQ